MYDKKTAIEEWREGVQKKLDAEIKNQTETEEKIQELYKSVQDMRVSANKTDEVINEITVLKGKLEGIKTKIKRHKHALR